MPILTNPHQRFFESVSGRPVLGAGAIEQFPELQQQRVPTRTSGDESLVGIVVKTLAALDSQMTLGHEPVQDGRR